MSDPTPPPSRRAFLCRAAGASAATLGLALIAPPLIALVAPPEGDAPPTDLWVPLGPPDRFPVAGPPTRVVLKHTERDAWVSRPGVLGSIWVQRRADADFLIHSSRCTHLGCAITLAADHFACPCHGATFALDGTIRGSDSPAPRPLDTLEWRLGAQGLEVRYQRFQLDTPTKAALT